MKISEAERRTLIQAISRAGRPWRNPEIGLSAYRDQIHGKRVFWDVKFARDIKYKIITDQDMRNVKDADIAQLIISNWEASANYPKKKSLF